MDSSLLAPNIFTDDLNDLVSVSITFTGLTASPSSTTFTKDDLAFWVFSTEFSGEIFDMNFFMRGVPSNTDGYAIDGVQVSTLALCNAPADPIQGGCPARTGLDTFTIAITDIGPADGTRS